MQQLLPALIAIGIATLAVYSDWRRGIIPNFMTIPAMALGLALNGALGGWSGLGLAAGGLALGTGLLVVPFLRGATGGGDLKLLAALGALLGPGAVFQVFVCAALAGGIVALAIIARSLLPPGVVRLLGRKPALRPSGPVRAATFPYAPSLWCGVVLVASLPWG